MGVASAPPHLRELLDDFGLQPLSTRSLVLSLLLGIQPPRLDVGRLVTHGELLGVRGGTTRTALSRLVASGDLVADAGVYELSPRLRERQRQQELGWQADAAAPAWDGSWWTVVVADDHRNSTTRRHFRSAMLGWRLGELRPDTWMRPANLEGPTGRDDVLVTRGPLLGALGPTELASRLWDLDDTEHRASRLVAAAGEVDQLLDADPARWLRVVFDVSAVCVSFLRIEPRLPGELASLPRCRELRDTYPMVNAHFQRALRELADDASSNA